VGSCGRTRLFGALSGEFTKSLLLFIRKSVSRMANEESIMVCWTVVGRLFMVVLFAKESIGSLLNVVAFVIVFRFMNRFCRSGRCQIFLPAGMKTSEANRLEKCF
jgi:hypothetical protein